MMKRALPTGRIKDETGKRYGRLVVLGIAARNNGLYWACRCSCGGSSVVKGADLRNGSTRSCGCGSIEQALRNMEKARTAKMIPVSCPRKLKDLYRNMLDRCYNSKNKRWVGYGGRGITVCKAWRESRAAFYEWAIANGIRHGVQIDRIRNGRGYSPSNCRFVDGYVQANNTRKNRWLTWRGESMTLAQWARRIGVNPRAIQHRLARGWSTRRIFTQPYRAPRYPK